MSGTSNGRWSSLLGDTRSLIVAIVGGLVVALAIAKLGVFHTDSSPADAKSAVGEVHGLPLWANGRTTSFSLPDLHRRVDQATVTAGDVVALTPRDAWREGATYEGKPLYLVGRVLDEHTQNTRFLPHHEIKLRGYTNGFVAYLATDSPSLAKVTSGELVYALGFVAAAGRSGEQQDATIYFVTPKDADAGPVSQIENRNAVWTRAQTAIGSQPQRTPIGGAR